MDADSLIRLVLRFFLVPLGTTAALVAGTAVLIVAHHQEFVALIQASPQAQEDYFVALVFAGPLLAMLLSIWAFHVLVPAVIGILISEALAIRSWTYHAANGAVAAWIGWVLTRDIRDEYRFLTELNPLIAAGLVAGLAYWLVAGWTAGFLKPVWPPRPQPVALS